MLTAREPIVELRAFKDRNFAFGSAFSFVMGIGLYGLTYLYPVYLSQVRGYDALMIGETMFVTGVVMFLTAPLSGRLAQVLDPRVMMLVGFAGFGLGTWWASSITSDWDFNELLIPQILRGCSLMICMVPINNLSLGTLSPAQLKNASGLFNLMRNLGGAVGLALINTLLNKRLDLHLARLARERLLGPARRGGYAVEHDAEHDVDGAGRRSHGAEAAEPSGTHAGQRHVVRGRILRPELPVRRPRLLRADDEKARRGRPWRRPLAFPSPIAPEMGRGLPG